MSIVIQLASQTPAAERYESLFRVSQDLISLIHTGGKRRTMVKGYAGPALGVSEREIT